MDFASASTSPRNNFKFISELIKREWFDSFRTIYPEKRAYSRIGTAGKKNKYLTASRIDHILIRKGRLGSLFNSLILEGDDCDSDHRLVLTQIHTEIPTGKKAEKKIKIREGLKDKNKWKEFQTTLPPLNPMKDIHTSSKELKEKILDNFNKTFPEKEITKRQLGRGIFKSKKYGEYKGYKKLCFRIAAHVKGVLYDNKSENRDQLTRLIEKINEPPILMRTEYSQDTLVAAHENEIIYNKKIRALLRKEKREKIKEKVQKILDQIDEDGHKAYKLLRETRDTETPCLIEEEKIITNKDEIEDKLFNTWKEIFQHKTARNDKIEQFLSFLPKPQTGSPTPEFTLENMRRIINNKNPTAPGESKISWQMLKHCTDEYLTTLTQIYTYMYENNLCPSEWKQGITTLIPKPGTAPTPDGFRPITLLSVEYKLYTGILTEALLKWTLENNIIPPSQNGALADRGCDTCLWTLISTINECYKEDHPLHVFYIDYSKAFDSVEHWVIEAILEHLNLGHLGYVIHSLLIFSSTRLKINNEISDRSIPIQKGTKQGDVISPLLFLLFMAPLLWKIETECKGVEVNGIKMKCGAIMDDVVLTTDSVSDAKKMMEIMTEYSEITGIQINPKKSAYAYRKVDTKFLPTINGKKFADLGSTTSYRYLGVWINLELDWKDTQEKMFDSMKITLAKISKKFYIPPYIMCKLLNATVYAMIGYRMQIIMFDRSWLNKVEYFIKDHLNRTYGTPTYGTAVWTLAYNLKPLQNLNFQRYIGSLWRTLQRNENNLAKNNLLTLLSKKPNKIPIYGAIPWVEPQDVIHALDLQWFHRDLANNQFWPPTFAQSFPIISMRNEYPTETITAWVDGSLQMIDNEIYLASSITTNDGFNAGWPIRGPPSSTEAEIQAITGLLALHQNAKRIIVYSDSMAAIKAINKTAQRMYTNCHSSPNRVSLRELRTLSQNRTIIHTTYPVESKKPTLQLIHVHSHADVDETKRAKNEAKFGTQAHLHIKKNNIADTIAKKACTIPVIPHPPLHPQADPFQIFLPEFPFAEIKTLINFRTDRVEIDRYLAREQTKATRWLDTNTDMEATVHPMRAKGTTRQLQTFTLKILTSALATKHNIRKTRWYKELEDDHPKKKAYQNENCPLCDKVESHWHLFEECKATRHHRTSFINKTMDLIKKHSKHPPTPPEWWFSENVARKKQNDIDWRGFLPHNLKEYLRTVTGKSETANNLLQQIAIGYQLNNLEIWKQRCEVLHETQPKRR